MTEGQLSLLEQPTSGGVRKTDPPTSRVASVSNQVARVTQKKLILAYVLRHGEADSHSVAHLTGGQHNRASKRLGEMEAAKLLKVVRLVPAASGGNPRQVYALTDDGRRDAELMTKGAA